MCYCNLSVQVNGIHTDRHLLHPMNEFSRYWKQKLHTYWQQWVLVAHRQRCTLLKSVEFWLFRGLHRSKHSMLSSMLTDVRTSLNKNEWHPAVRIHLYSFVGRQCVASMPHLWWGPLRTWVYKYLKLCFCFLATYTQNYNVLEGRAILALIFLKNWQCFYRLHHFGKRV